MTIPNIRTRVSCAVKLHDNDESQRGIWQDEIITKPSISPQCGMCRVKNSACVLECPY